MRSVQRCQRCALAADTMVLAGRVIAALAGPHTLDPEALPMLGLAVRVTPVPADQCLVALAVPHTAGQVGHFILDLAAPHILGQVDRLMMVLEAPVTPVREDLAILAPGATGGAVRPYAASAADNSLESHSRSEMASFGDAAPDRG